MDLANSIHLDQLPKYTAHLRATKKSIQSFRPIFVGCSLLFVYSAKQRYSLTYLVCHKKTVLFLLTFPVKECQIEAFTLRFVSNASSAFRMQIVVTLPFRRSAKIVRKNSNLYSFCVAIFWLTGWAVHSIPSTRRACSVFVQRNASSAFVRWQFSRAACLLSSRRVSFVIARVRPMMSGRNSSTDTPAMTIWKNILWMTNHCKLSYRPQTWINST